MWVNFQAVPKVYDKNKDKQSGLSQYTRTAMTRFQPIRICVTIQVSHFITKQYFPDGGQRSGESWSFDPVHYFYSNGKVLYNCGFVYFVLIKKKGFKGNLIESPHRI